MWMIQATTKLGEAVYASNSPRTPFCFRTVNAAEFDGRDNRAIKVEFFRSIAHIYGVKPESVRVAD